MTSPEFDPQLRQCSGPNSGLPQKIREGDQQVLSFGQPASIKPLIMRMSRREPANFRNALQRRLVLGGESLGQCLVWRRCTSVRLNISCLQAQLRSAVEKLGSRSRLPSPRIARRFVIGIIVLEYGRGRDDHLVQKRPAPLLNDSFFDGGIKSSQASAHFAVVPRSNDVLALHTKAKSHWLT